MSARRLVQKSLFVLASSGLLLSAAYSQCEAQRRPPSVGDYGLRRPDGRGMIVPAGIVVWDYWGIDLPTCERRRDRIECVVNVGNGVDEPHELCLLGPALKGSAISPATPMTVARVEKLNRGTAAISRSGNQVCTRLEPHASLDVILTSRRVPAEGARTLTVTLVERLQGKRADSTLRAQADMPIARVREIGPTP